MTSFVAKKMAQQKMKQATGGLTEPLISNKEGGDEENQQGGEGEEGKEHEEPSDTFGMLDYAIICGAIVSCEYSPFLFHMSTLADTYP